MIRNLPVVMPANRVAITTELNIKYPGRCANLYSQTSYTQPCGDPFALDNDRFSVWAKGRKWDGGQYEEFLDRINEVAPYPPIWAAVPDVVADPKGTLAWWDKWVGKVLQRGFRPALVVQDGMTPEIVSRVLPFPEVLFVGGSTDWKWRSLKSWTQFHSHVHVGRVNTGRLLWMVHRAEAASSDGTGWWHSRQYRQLESYLKMSNQGKSECNRGGGFRLFEKMEAQ